jgi:hypothetical protein
MARKSDQMPNRQRAQAGCEAGPWESLDPVPKAHLLRSTEPFILGLIILNAVVLIIQAAPALFEPRVDDGYFRSWEDAVLLVLFVIFT